MALDALLVRSPSILTINKSRIILGAQIGEANPSMASINANYTDWNQIIALHNRRTNQVLSSPNVMAYWTGTSLKASDVNTLRTNINAIRTALGGGAYLYTNTLSAGSVIRRIDFEQTLDALYSFTSVQTILPINLSGAVFLKTNESREKPYGTKNLVDINSNAGTIGTQHTTTGQCTRFRTGASFIIPGLSGVNAPHSASILTTFTSFSNTLEAWYPVVYASNTDDSTYVASNPGWQDHLNNLGGNATYGVTTAQAMSVPVASVAARFGGKLSLVWANNLEATGSESMPGGAALALATVVNLGSTALTIDWGF